jgi:hypothetical protein
VRMRKCAHESRAVRRHNGRRDGWTGGRVDGWTGGRVDRRTGGQADSAGLRKEREDGT